MNEQTAKLLQEVSEPLREMRPIFFSVRLKKKVRSRGEACHRLDLPGPRDLTNRRHHRDGLMRERSEQKNRQHQMHQQPYGPKCVDRSHVHGLPPFSTAPAHTKRRR
jgi:hypothetical protein